MGYNNNILINNNISISKILKIISNKKKLKD